MIETVIQQVGSIPSTTAQDDGSLGRADAYLLADIDDFYIVSVDDFYIDLGMILGGTPGGSSLVGSGIGTAPITPGTMV